MREPWGFFKTEGMIGPPPADFFLFVEFRLGDHDAGAAEITEDAIGVLPVDHGQPANVVFQHPCSRVVEGFVLVGDDQLCVAGFENGHGAREACRAGRAECRHG